MGIDVSAYADRLTERDWETGSVDGVLEFAVVGLGNFAEASALPAIADSEYCEATVGVSGSAEKAADFAERFDLDRSLTYEDFRDGEATDAYDAVYVVTPNALHLPYVEAAAEFGKDVLCEKPMEASVERAERMAAVCDEAGVTLMIAYRMVAEPLTRRVREMVADGAIGEIVQADGALCGSAIPDDPDPSDLPWRFDPDLAGGGALYDLGVYPMNTIRFVLDEDPTAVAASVNTQHELLEVDDCTAWQMAFDGDVVASCRTSYRTPGDNFYQVLGTQGRLRVEPAFDIAADRVVTVEHQAGSVELSDVSTNELVEEFDYFAHCVMTGETPEADAEMGLADMRTIAGIHESDETGRWVDL